MADEITNIQYIQEISAHFATVIRQLKYSIQEMKQAIQSCEKQIQKRDELVRYFFL